MKMHKYFEIISCISISFFISCSPAKTSEEEEVSAPVKTAITFTLPTTTGFTEYIQLNGNTQFQKKLVLRATITGYIIGMPWKTGDHISAGTLFCTIKTKEQDALSNIEKKDTSLRQFQTPLNVLTNTSGIFTAVNYSNGDLVNEGDILATITDPSSLVLVVNVPYEYHELVYKGKRCSVRFPDNKIIQATIQEEIPFVDAASQTQTYLIRFPGNQFLPENINLIVHIPVKQKLKAISLPLEAIQTNEAQDKFWVMKLVNDSLAIKVPIAVGIQNDSLREIISGVGALDKIIVKGAYGLTDSSLVMVQSEKE